MMKLRKYNSNSSCVSRDSWSAYASRGRVCALPADHPRSEKPPPPPALIDGMLLVSMNHCMNSANSAPRACICLSSWIRRA